jgi:hypothetical protein
MLLLLLLPLLALLLGWGSEWRGTLLWLRSLALQILRPDRGQPGGYPLPALVPSVGHPHGILVPWPVVCPGDVEIPILEPYLVVQNRIALEHLH